MFERYTEKARRVIFFARYEASQYGSPVHRDRASVARPDARGQGSGQPLPAFSRLDRVHPQGDRTAHHHSRAHLHVGGSAAQPGIQAHPEFRHRRSRAPRAQARRHRAPAAGHPARREVLRRGNSAGARAAAVDAARGTGAQRRREKCPRRVPRKLRCWRNSAAT